tara:strand:+ start:358 stop:630 length:273 start_codon:yes stop_codon:yes gene_type:complete
MNMDSYPREKREPRHLTPRSNKSIKHGVSGTKRYNLATGGFIFLQDSKERNKFHMPGGMSATESQIHKLAKDKGWRTPKRQYININRIDL